MKDITEEEAIILLKVRDEKAFRFIYDSYYIGLCRLARGYLRDAYLSESLVEDTICSIWENYDRIEIKTSLKSYLYRSVTNKCINYLQLEFVKREASCTTEDILTLGKLWTIKDNSPLEQLLMDELEEKIKEAIENLPENTKEVFCLSRYEDKKYEEIASMLNISVDMVKYHIKKALQLLRFSMEKYLATYMILVGFICEQNIC